MESVEQLKNSLAATRREISRLRQQLSEVAVNTAAQVLLPVVENRDHIQMSIEQFPSRLVDEEKRPPYFVRGKSVRDGITGMNMTLHSMNSYLERQGIRKVDPECGSRFNPAKMEAVSSSRDSDVPAGRIIRTVEPGYLLSSRGIEKLLRPAKVIVATE